MEMTVKEPGLEMRTRTASLNASFAEGDVKDMDAYEDLLLEVIEGDQSLFLRWDEVEWAWRIVDPVIRAWATDDKNIDTYPAGSWGASKSRRLFDNEDVTWRHSVGPETHDASN
jgi:glucose-6-phosphate 1-dehydrogenase